MGMWSKVNTKENLWERATGREYGFENRTARVRRHLRDAVDTSEETVPDTRRATAARNRQMEKHSREVEKLAGQINKKRKEVQRLIKAKRAGEAQRLQAEVDQLQNALDSRRREMSRNFL